eukprot:TRINITY_DN12076_c3_g1_i1.p1 TRINITY_DN12076_c3_g1~~TRINITY_DN12076_c3_g1_i1.p1  ORF type:complete len:830 (+),score=314.38 TRINITY_DN12076_c3_g1_i1:251-2740(+)
MAPRRQSRQPSPPPSSRGDKPRGSVSSASGRRKSRQASATSAPAKPESRFQVLSTEIPEAPGDGPAPGAALGASGEQPAEASGGGRRSISRPGVSIVDPPAGGGAEAQPHAPSPRGSVGHSSAAADEPEPESAAAAAAAEAPAARPARTRAESIAARRDKELLVTFEEMDLDGDGRISQAELREGLQELGAYGVTDDDVSRFFIDADSITFESFRDRKVLRQLRDIRNTKAAEDCAAHGRAAAQRGTFFPERLLRRVLEFASDTHTLRALAATSVLWRQWATHDELWKPLLVRRRRMEQAKSAAGANSLPEIRCGRGYYQWYLAWVMETAAQRGTSAQLRHVKEEMLDNGDAQGVQTETVLCAVSALVYPPPPAEPPPEGAEAEMTDLPPPPPPPLPDVLTGDEKGFVQLRQLSTPEQPLQTLSEHDTTIEAIVVSDAFIWVASADCTVTVWPRENLSRPAFSLTAHKEAVSVLELAPWDERCCVTGSMDRTAIIWNRVEAAPQRFQRKSAGKEAFAQQVQPRRVLDKGHTMKVTAVVLQPHVLFTASRDCLVVLWDWDGRVVTKIEGHMGPVNCLCVARGPTPVEDADEAEAPADAPAAGGARRQTAGPAGAALTARAPRTTRSPSAASPAAGSPMAAARGLRGGDVPDDGTIIASACGGGLVKGWNLRGKQQFSRRLHESPIEEMVACRELGLVLTGSWDNTVSVFNPETGNIPCVLKGHEGAIRSVVVDQSRRRIITASDDKSVAIWDFVSIDLGCSREQEKATLVPHLVLKGPKTPVTACALIRSHDSRWHSLVAVSKSATLFVWRFRDDAQFQMRGMRLITPKD